VSTVSQKAVFWTRSNPKEKEYPLKNATILDSGASVHIFNHVSRFSDLKPAPYGDYVTTGNGPIPIQGYGNVEIIIRSPIGNHILRLYGAAYCPDFPCNIASFTKLQDLGLYWDTRKASNSIRREETHEIICFSEERNGQFLLEDLPEEHSAAAFVARRHIYNTRTKRKARKADAMKWHLRLGHPGPMAMEHLVNLTLGVRIKGPTTVQCDGCGLGKMKRIIRRAPREADEGPGERLAIDLHPFEQGYGMYSHLLLATDRWSGYTWDFYLQKSNSETIIEAITQLINLLDRQYNIQPKVFEADNEVHTLKTAVKEHLQAKGYRIEPSAPYTQAQNGLAERAGDLVKTKIRTLAQGAKLPGELWPEITKAAVYLINRTPKVDFQWKTPFEKLHLRSDRPQLECQSVSRKSYLQGVPY
jgi:hypothetical protein